MTTTGLSLFAVSQRFALPLYALIDPLVYPALPAFWRAFQPRAEHLWQTLQFTDAAADWQPAAPMVVQIDEGGPGETLLHWLQDTQQPQHHGIVLMHSNLPLAAIREHWQQRIRCHYPDETCALWRSWSPSLLRQWWPTMNAEQQQAFAAGLHALWLPLESSEAGECCYQPLWANDTTSENPPDYRIALSRYQFYLLADENRLHRLANMLWLHAIQFYREELAIEQVKSRFLSGIAAAENRYPHASGEECEGWSAHRWLLGSEFYLHPQFVHLTQRYPLGESLRIFKSDPAQVEDVRLNYHRPGWMRGELADLTENTA